MSRISDDTPVSRYAAAVLMCASLAVLGLADLGSATDRETQIFGMGLLVVRDPRA